MANWLDSFFEKLKVMSAGALQNARAAVDFTGPGFTVTDDSVNNKTIVNIDVGNIDNNTSRFGADDLRRVYSRVTRVLSTDAVQFTLDSYTLPADTGADFVITVQARKVSTGDYFKADLRVSYIRNGSGVATIKGALSAPTPIATGALGSAVVTVDTDGANAVRIRATGVAATNVNWKASWTQDLIS